MLMFWGLAAAMVVMVVALMVLALRRDEAQVVPAAEFDLRVYRDQLRDIERDLERGVIGPDEAERLRVEIGRRILAADQAAQTVGAQISGPRGGLVTGALVLALLGATLATYVGVGRPGASDLPLALRLAEADAARRTRDSQDTAEAAMLRAVPAPTDPQHAALIQQLREIVAQRPDDLQGHQLLMRNEAALGNYTAAWRAQERVVALRGSAVDVDEVALQADLMIRAAGGFVSPEAEQVLARALQMDPRHRQTRYFTGLMFLQNDRPDRTFQVWSQLWTDSRAGDPWAPFLERQLPDVAFLAGEHRYEMPPLRGAEPGPDAAALEAAQDMSPEERSQMVRGMVDGLAERLATDGGPAADWARLIRALGVLGETERASAILAEAQQVFASNAADLGLLSAAAQAAGIAP
jgi:cytochrome c-type biogenesis protein CcmH